MRSQGPQYYYDPSGSKPDWLQRLAPLKEEPLCYVVFAAGMILAILLITMSPSFQLQRIGYHLIVLLIAFPIHELSHAVVADRLGDPTPRYYGRITLNPLAQLNLIGSLLMIFVGLGWAYVPINPSNLRPDPKIGHMIVAAAGPISNLVLAILAAILWYILSPILADNATWLLYARDILSMFALFNFALFLFNLIPIAPLDGFVVLKGLLPYDMAYQLQKYQRYGLIIFMGAFFIAPLLGLPIVSWLIFDPAIYLTSLLF